MTDGSLPHVLMAGIAVCVLAASCSIQKTVGTLEPDGDGSADVDSDTDTDADVEGDTYDCPMEPDAGLSLPFACEMFTETDHPWQEGCCMPDGRILIVEEYSDLPDAGSICSVTTSACPPFYHCCYEITLDQHDCCPD